MKYNAEGNISRPAGKSNFMWKRVEGEKIGIGTNTLTPIFKTVF